MDLFCPDKGKATKATKATKHTPPQTWKAAGPASRRESRHLEKPSNSPAMSLSDWMCAAMPQGQRPFTGRDAMVHTERGPRERRRIKRSRCGPNGQGALVGLLLPEGGTTRLKAGLRTTQRAMLGCGVLNPPTPASAALSWGEENHRCAGGAPSHRWPRGASQGETEA